MLTRIKRSVAYAAYKEKRKALLRKLKLAHYRGEEHCCPVCETQLRAFKPIWKSFNRNIRKHGYVYPISSLETFNASAYSCPACDASDRERLYALYLDGLFGSLDLGRRYRLIEFAPSAALRRKLITYPFLAYRSVDLLRRDVDDRVDIADMRIYEDESVDIFICSHVLEHVPHDRKALQELCRVLKPAGRGIIMVPLLHGVDETQEDPSVDTDALRWKYYGSGDHIRQYGKRDFIGRLADAGFHVDQLDIDYFGKEAFRRAGIAADSVLYVVRKAGR